MEPYVNLPEKTQLQLASILTLSNNPRENRDKLIALSYTDSEIEYQEKVLNLKWSLYGDWKIINFLTYFGEESNGKKESGVKIFNDFLKIVRDLAENREFKRSMKLNDYLGWLFSFSKEIEVRGKDFETGIDSLFQLLTSNYIKDGVVFPSILIHKNGNIFYSAFWWIPEKAGFARLTNPTHVPDYAKKFFDSMQKKD